MTKKNILTVSAIFLLGALSLYLNKDRFASDVIQISHRSITPRGTKARTAASKAPANEVIFLATKSIKLKSVKVVLVDDAQTNKYPHAIWDLVSDSNSIPVKEFVYGTSIRGMQLALKGIGADALQPGFNYRILVETAAGKLQHDFVPTPRSP